MSLPILAALVVVGILAIVLTVHFTGRGRSLAFAGPDEAVTRYRVDFADAVPLNVWLTSDRNTAFIDLGDARLGVVHAVGARHLTRQLTPGDVASVELRKDGRLAVRFRDFAWRSGVFAFDDRETSRAVLERMPLDGKGR